MKLSQFICSIRVILLAASSVVFLAAPATAQNSGTANTPAQAGNNGSAARVGPNGATASVNGARSNNGRMANVPTGEANRVGNPGYNGSYNNSGGWGLWGLVGLLGLFGLFRGSSRPMYPNNTRDYTRQP